MGLSRAGGVGNQAGAASAAEERAVARERSLYLKTLFPGCEETIILQMQGSQQKGYVRDAIDAEWELNRWDAYERIGRIAPVTFARAGLRGPITEPHATFVLWDSIESPGPEAHESLIHDMEEDPYGPHQIVECGPVVEPYWLLQDVYRLESAEDRARYEATLAKFARRYREDAEPVTVRDFARVPGVYDRPTNRPHGHAGLERVRLRYRSERGPISFERLEAIAGEPFAPSGNANAGTTTDRTLINSGAATPGRQEEPKLPASVPRKPRGVPNDVRDLFRQRESLCCAACRRRTTPKSLRFLGQRVYVAGFMVLISAMQCGLTQKRAAALQPFIDVSARTLRRWLIWWREAFPRTPFWKSARARFRSPLDTERLPASLLEKFPERCLRDRLRRLLEFISPMTTRSTWAVDF